MYRATILPLAKVDIREAIKWYESRQKDLGKTFYDQLNQKFTFIRQNPEAVAIKYRDTRVAVLQQFPYLVHYRIIVEQQLIVVSAVLHAHSRPKH
jgi:hypothetical protein